MSCARASPARWSSIGHERRAQDTWLATIHSFVSPGAMVLRQCKHRMRQASVQIRVGFTRQPLLLDPFFFLRRVPNPIFRAKLDRVLA